MKKRFKGAIVALMAAVCCFCCVLFVACGGSIAGTYKFYSTKVEVAGVAVELKAGESYLGLTLNDDFASMTFNDDGTGTVTTMGITESFTWTKSADSENTYVLTAGTNDTTTVTIDNGTLVFGSDGATITLKK